uniref:Dynamin-type G domain-containing protein n=1 Tax=Macrostomum lignano TaxID=282301 RepID=A0A1I8GQL3_9PLAT
MDTKPMPAMQLVQTSSQMRTTSQNTRIPRGSGRQKLSLNDVGEQYVLLLDAIDKLKLGSEIDLPEIVVLGDQSEGKSTVLEAIAKCKQRFGRAYMCIHQIFFSFDGKSINVESQEDFSSKLKDIMNENDMKDDDENTVALREKLNKPNILMVVVLKAVNDIDTSKGYDFAKRLDPEFKRTVFVLTHCDNLAENKQQKNLWRDEAKELEKLKDENDGANSELKNLFIKLNKKLEEQLTGTCRKKKNELFSECKMKWNKFEQDLKTIAEEVLEPNH